MNVQYVSMCLCIFNMSVCIYLNLNADVFFVHIFKVAGMDVYVCLCTYGNINIGMCAVY